MRTKKRVLAITIVTIVGIAGFAFAHGASGTRGHHMGNMGYGGHMGMGTGHHMGYGGQMGDGEHMGYGDHERYSGLTDEQLQRIDKARSDFLIATRDLQGDLYQKRLELRSELAKEEPDIDKIMKIQKELSKIEANLDIKRLGHELELRSIAPEAYRRSTGRGYGTGGYCYGDLPR